MVVVEVPLWVIHSNVIKTTWDVDCTDVRSTNTEDEVDDGNRIFLKSLFHSNSNKNLGRNAIYSIDSTCSYTTTVTGTNKKQLRFATGGGDGKVRIWSCSSLVTATTTATTPPPTATPTPPPLPTTTATAAAATKEGIFHNGKQPNNRRRIAAFTEKGGYESSSSSGNSSTNSSSSTCGAKVGTWATTTTSSTPSNNNTTTASSSSRLLATLATHEGASVLCVRWSHSGHYLASAGDDGHVLLYCQKKQPQKHFLDTTTTTTTTATTSTSATTEHWARVRTCRGHHLDVVGLAWAAPDDRFLASCSLDVETPIIIWKLYETLVGIPGYDISKAKSTTSTSTILTPFQVLGQSIHTSAVKGIVWDPIGKYLISSGDDPAICVWRTTADWGLEARIDSTSGIFTTSTTTTTTSSSSHHHHHQKEKKNIMQEDSTTATTTNGTTTTYNDTLETTEQLANVSLFRRISFSYDGSHLCATNATVKGKNIAAMIAREGWVVSTGKASTSTTTAAANLIGHKQPIVASRHLPILISHSNKKSNKRKLTTSDDASASLSQEVDEDDDDDEEEDIEPSYASIVALGDKRGFVSVWSTKSSRPIFKIQVSSEKSKCTITDLSWTTTTTNTNISSNTDGAILLVSMLDGYIASLQFTWEELGGLPLTFKQRSRLFRLRYGIELVDDININAAIRMKYSDETKLLENAFQLNLEEDYSTQQNNNLATTTTTVTATKSVTAAPKQIFLSSKSTTTNDVQDTKAKQIESRTIRGKKRIQPVLVSVEEDMIIDNNDNAAPGGDTAVTTTTSTANGPVEATPTDPLTSAIQDAKKAASVAQDLSNKYSKRQQQQRQQQRLTSSSSLPQPGSPSTTSSSYEFYNTPILIPTSTNQTFSVTLSSERKTQKQQKLMDAWSPAVGCDNSSSSLVADCTNTSTSSASSGTTTKATLTVSCQGTVIWKSTVVGAKCTSLAASCQRLAMGTYDGTIYLYGTTVGFPSGFIVRSFPPLILGSSIALLQLVENDKLLAICSNGDFRVYDLASKKLLQKGSAAPVFSHVRLLVTTSHVPQQQNLLPKLVRAQLTSAGVVILVSMQHRAAIAASGSSLQAFLYDPQLEEWERVADGRFALSDFYVGRSSSSSSSVSRQTTTLSELDSLVSLTSSGSADSTNIASAIIGSICQSAGQKNDVSRAHCEDRMACSLALGSASEFQHWLRLYSRLLTSEGDVTYLRCLCDALLGNKQHPTAAVDLDITLTDTPSITNIDLKDLSANKPTSSSLWWLDSTTDTKILGLDRADLLRLVLAEMGRNRELQRLTNEVLIELSTL